MKATVANWLNDQFGGEAEVIAAIWSEYLAGTEEKIGECDAALAVPDYPLLDRIAHTLKGNGLMVGNEEAAKAAIALRDASKVGDHAGCAAAIERIKSVFAADKVS